MLQNFVHFSNSLGILSSSLKKQNPFCIDGIHNPSVLALLISQAELANFQIPHLIIFPEDHQLQEFQKAFLFFEKGRPVYELPAFDVSPYSGLYPNKSNLAKRLNWLHKAGVAKTGDVFVATTESICQNTLPYSIFHKNQWLLEKGTELSENFIEKLRQRGYQQVPTLEDIGSFAFRGGILDIYSPSYKMPFRIELFGNQIESLRFFNPQSQRSTEEVTSTLILPARETLFEQIPIDQLLANFNKSLSSQNLLEDELVELRRSLSQKNYFFGSDFLLPLFYEKLSSPLEFFNEAPYLWLFQKDDIYRSADHLMASYKEAFHSLKTSAIRPHPGELYSNFETLPWPDKNLFIEVERIRLEEKSSLKGISIKSFPLTEFSNQFQGLSTKDKEQIAFLKKSLDSWKQEAYQIIILAQTQNSAKRLQILFEKADFSSQICTEEALNNDPDILPLFVGSVPSSFRLPQEKIILLRDFDFWGRKTRSYKKDQKQNFKDRAEVLSFGELKPGDRVVHRQHGVGIYDGLNVIDIDGVKSEFLQLQYKDKDRLYLPVYRVNQLQKYSGPSATNLLDKLGGKSWAKTSGKVKSQIRDIAAQLLQLYAKRSQAKKIPFSTLEENYKKFEDEFPYEETEDQQRTIDDVLSDMLSEKPMDRLICGDVGFGKTEVALRAAFKAAEDHRQVAIIAPTTILSFQHYETFKNRFKDWPIHIETLNRFVPNKKQKSTLQKLKSGEVDILIGTHRLLSKDIEFKNLGLLIVDEEQKFGVSHKEKLRKLREGIDTMAMSATPIPRTLNMSLMGIRDLSLINTPPEDRLPTRTYISRFNASTIEKAVQAEIQRGGQVFFLHNRVQSIYGRAEELRKILPNIRIAVAHGQMKESDLETTMMKFFKHELDLLLCTAIIESGMDIPRANTIFIDDAHMFGVNQLYQLRGRVGRSKERAYCYLLMPKNKKIDSEAQERLRIIQENTALGSGFRVAQYDLELRGAGDLLGAEQSGHIKAVGYEMYMNLLQEAVEELSNDKKKVTDIEPEINLRIPAFIPDDYIPDIRIRLSYYKALSQLTDPYELDIIEEELRDQFGQLPNSVMNLMGLMLIRKDCKDLGLRDASAGNHWLTLAFTEHTRLHPEDIVRLTSQENKKYKITPDQRLKIRMKEISWPRVHNELELLIKLLPKK